MVKELSDILFIRGEKTSVSAESEKQCQAVESFSV